MPYLNVIEADIRGFDSHYRLGVDLLSGGYPCGGSSCPRVEAKYLAGIS